MVTCFLRYVINPAAVLDFETYAKTWMRLVAKFGGIHHGYFLPSEGASNVALALFSFSSLAKYEQYRELARVDDEGIAAIAFAEQARCIVSFERSFFRPVLQQHSVGAP